jgi:hypothetical protein
MSTEEPGAAPDAAAIGMWAHHSKERYDKVWLVYLGGHSKPATDGRLKTGHHE